MFKTLLLERKKSVLIASYLFLLTLHLFSCKDKPNDNTSRKNTSVTRIPGKSDSIPAEAVEQGEVLIAYSDCYTCHKENEKSVGPSFTNIAKRYPANKAFIDMLAQKVILGGNGTWGSPVMDSHPNLSFEHAKLMVTYILSKKDDSKNR